MTDMSDIQSPHDFFKNFVQIGVVVADLDETIHHLTDILGIGPFRVIDWPPAERSDIQKNYYGKPTEFTARMAFTELGQIELELIQPVSGKSIWADFLEKHGSGIHHIRFNVDELDPVQGYLEGKGIVPIQYGTGIRPGTTWMNLASDEKFGFMIEIMNVLPGTDGRTPQIEDGKVIS